jgi:hypothetical protein
MLSRQCCTMTQVVHMQLQTHIITKTYSFYQVPSNLLKLYWGAYCKSRFGFEQVARQGGIYGLGLVEQRPALIFARELYFLCVLLPTSRFSPLGFWFFFGSLCLVLPGLAFGVGFHGSLRLFSSACVPMQGFCLILMISLVSFLHR